MSKLPNELGTKEFTCIAHGDIKQHIIVINFNDAFTDGVFCAHCFAELLQKNCRRAREKIDPSDYERCYG